MGYRHKSPNFFEDAGIMGNSPARTRFVGLLEGERARLRNSLTIGVLQILVEPGRVHRGRSDIDERKAVPYCCKPLPDNMGSFLPNAWGNVNTLKTKVLRVSTSALWPVFSILRGASFQAVSNPSRRIDF
jgi:hypothetical protein